MYQIHNPVTTTKFYNLHYSQIPMEVRYLIPKDEFERHPFFDMYAVGKIIEKYCLNKRF